MRSKDFVRQMIAMVGNSSGHGQQVRDEILNILHRNKIGESNSHFYEQWHQKLHNNTTPDDVPICEALLAFLRSGGDMRKYWEVLDRNGITRERLASYERKIVMEPFYKDGLVGDFEYFLQILKKMHSSTDLWVIADRAWGSIGHEGGELRQVLDHMGHWDTLQQIRRVTELRKKLKQWHLTEHCGEDKLVNVLYLDNALESLVRQGVESILHVDIGYKNYLAEIEYILMNLSYSYEFSEIAICLQEHRELVMRAGEHLDEDAARRVKSVLDRARTLLATVSDAFSEHVQSYAEEIGTACGLEEFVVKQFSEEVIRGSLFFALSMVIRKVEPFVRERAHLGDWMVISPGRGAPVRGEVVFVEELRSVMLKRFDRPTVLLVRKVTGEEEVPEGVVAIVLAYSVDYPDVLAHVSVRARNCKVLFCVAFSAKAVDPLMQLEGSAAELRVEGNLVVYEELPSGL